MRNQNLRLFQYSPWDTLLVLAVLFFACVTVVGTLFFRQLHWGWLGLAGVVSVLSGAIAQNAQHYHSHTPLFTSSWLNRLFHVWLTVVYGTPSSGYSRAHAYHHKYTIDYNHLTVRSVLGLTSARSFLMSLLLTYVDAFKLGYVVVVVQVMLASRKPSAGGESSKAESDEQPKGSSFETLGDYTDSLVMRVIEYGKKDAGYRRQLLLEVSAALVFRVALCALDYRGFFLFFVPAEYFLNRFQAYSEYCTHYGADESDRMTNSASSYGKVFNFFWFNFGYHQEHHARPAVHWRKLPQVREHMVAEDRRRVVPGTLMLNGFLPGPRAAEALAAPAPESSASLS